MIKQSLIVSVLSTALTLTNGLAFAAEKPATQEKETVQNREQVFGSQLMSPQERVEHRTKMRAAKNAEEREKIRSDHHERMKERAHERGLTLPDKPPSRRSGMGYGGGSRR